MSDAEWLIIVSVLVVALYLVLVKDWRLDPESHVYHRPPPDSKPPVNRPDSADY